MAKISLEQAIKQNIELGFERSIIEIAYANVNGDANKIIEEIFRLQEMSNQYPTKPTSANDEDAQLSKAIEMSINQAKDKKISLEPLNPEQRVRKSGVPVGLKNIGNTCYFNSLLQTYFQNVEFVRTVLAYQTPQKFKTDKKPAEGEDAMQFKRKQASCKLVQNMKILFANMIASDRKYIDPTDVITSVVDDYGNEIPIGDQKDIGEFNLIFLSRIDEGLQLVKKQHEMVAQNEPKIDSPSKVSVFGDDHKDENNPSLVSRSSIKIEQNSIINQEFIGNMQNSYINQAHNIHQSEQEQFSLLFVNVKHKQLYKGLQQITIQHIDDYRNEKGQVVGVQKQSWIKKAPKTLFFQIDRVLFDKETNQLKKINDEFDFPETFYIDPFLLQNKDKALAVQKRVRELRQEREKYTNAVKKFLKFGEKNLNLLDTLSNTISFFKHQSDPMETEEETENPTVFPHLKSKITPQHINLLRTYQQQVLKRIETYNKKIQAIEEEIQKIYSTIKSTPYHLYSILIHEGSADSGHYYSYTYDIKSKIWRKYNDINISEENVQQVMKEARGINYTSAYYLVYSQASALMPSYNEQNLELRNYELSSGSNYLKDYYSLMIPADLRAKISTQNQQLYYEIEQFKMGAFANRVIDSYAKKFQTCNESFRKAKYEKKKNSPPFLANLPLYLKVLNQDQDYKSSLLFNAISEYGPKEQSPVFEDLLKKKMANFNDFKKPKNITFNQLHAQVFMSNLYKLKAAIKLFEALKNQQYRGVFGLINELKSGQPSEYFDWLSKLVCKVLMVTFLIQAEQLAQKKEHEAAIERLRLMVVLGLHYINRQEQKQLINNCVYWTSEIAIQIQGQLKPQAQSIGQLLLQEGKNSPYDEIMLSNNAINNVIDEIKNSTDIADSLWNLSRSENTEGVKLQAVKDEVKKKMESANEIYRQMKRKNIPLNKQEREQVIKKLSK